MFPPQPGSDGCCEGYLFPLIANQQLLPQVNLDALAPGEGMDGGHLRAGDAAHIARQHPLEIRVGFGRVVVEDLVPTGTRFVLQGLNHVVDGASVETIPPPGLEIGRRARLGGDLGDLAPETPLADVLYEGLRGIDADGQHPGGMDVAQRSAVPQVVVGAEGCAHLFEDGEGLVSRAGLQARGGSGRFLVEGHGVDRPSHERPGVEAGALVGGRRDGGRGGVAGASVQHR